MSAVISIPDDARAALNDASNTPAGLEALRGLGHTHAEAQALVRAWKAERAAITGAFCPHPLGFDFDVPDDPPDWIVARTIERGTVTVLSGDTGSAKSLVTASLIRAALAGEPWLGKRTAADRLLVIDEENPGRLARARLRALGVTNAMRDRLRYYGREGIAVADEGRCDSWLRRELEEFAPDLVVIDTLMSAAAVTDTNSNTEAVRVMKHLRGLAREFGCGLLLMHHERKRAMDDTRASGQHMMGARQWAGQADAHMTLTVESDFIAKPAERDGHELTRRTFIFRPAEKDRDGRANGKRRLAVESERDERGRYVWMKVSDEGTADTETERDVMSTAILGTLRESDREKSRRDLAAALGCEPDDSTFKRALSDLEQSGKVEKPQRGRYALTEHGRSAAGLTI